MSTGPPSVPSTSLPRVSSHYQINAPTSHQNPGSVGPQTHAEQVHIERVDAIQALLTVNSIRESLNCILDNLAKSTSRSQTIASSQTEEPNNDLDNMDLEQKLFLKKTDIKFLNEKANDISTKLTQLDTIVNNLPPVVITNNDFIPLLVDQIGQDEKSLTIGKIFSNYRGWQKFQEQFSTINQQNPYNIQYKRYQVPYNEKKSNQYKQYKPVNKINDFERTLNQFMNNHLQNQPTQIIVKVTQSQDKEIVITLIMPQNFKFVLHLIDYCVEKLIVREVDTRFMNSAINKIDEDRKQKLLNVFERLEDLCLFAAIHFRHLSENNAINGLKQFLNWLKSYSNLFNAKCLRCEKHLVNGLPPLWRDLKSNDAYHEECKP